MIMDTKNDTTTPERDERAADSALSASAGSQLDVSDIVQMAVKERKERHRKEYRKKEIEDQIAELEKELGDLSGDWMFEPRWTTELRQRVEAVIDSMENTEDRRPEPETSNKPKH